MQQKGLDTPPESDRDLVEVPGQKQGLQTKAVNGGRRRHAVQGADKSGGGCQVEGVRNIQVGDAPCW